MARRKAEVNTALREKLLEKFEGGEHWTANELAEEVGWGWSPIFAELERMKRERIIAKEPQRWYLRKPEP